MGCGGDSAWVVWVQSPGEALALHISLNTFTLMELYKAMESISEA